MHNNQFESKIKIWQIFGKRLTKTLNKNSAAYQHDYLHSGMYMYPVHCLICWNINLLLLKRAATMLQTRGLKFLAHLKGLTPAE